MAQEFPTSGLVPVAIPLHRCEPLSASCGMGGVHVVMLDKPETLCGRDCSHWRQEQEEISQLLAGPCLGHFICLVCQRMLQTHVTAAAARARRKARLEGQKGGA